MSADPAPVGRHVVVCVLRALAAVAAALLLAAGIGLLIWAITPSSGTATEMMRAAVTGLGAANFLPPTIGGILVTLPPLTLTAGCFVLVASAANRGRTPGIGPGLELTGAAVVGLVYGATLTAAIAALAPAGAATSNVSRAWAPVLLGVSAAALGVMLRAKGWRGWWRSWAPAALSVGIRAGGAALLLIICGGAVALAAGLATSFGTATDLASMAAPSIGDGIGLVLLSVAFLPNAVIAGSGYATGIGFQLGAGTYSPLGSTGIQLPALPLLAAVPDTGGLSSAGIALLIFPLAGAVLIGWFAVRRLTFRRERIYSVVVAAGVVAIVVTVLAAVSGGGVAGSPWAHFGVPVLGFGAVSFAGLGVLSLGIVLLAGGGRGVVQASPAVASNSTPDGDFADPDRTKVNLETDLVPEPAGFGSPVLDAPTQEPDEAATDADPPDGLADPSH